MGIRWGNGIPSALRGTTAVYANGYAVRCVKLAVFPRRCSITLRHFPSDFSISTTDLFEAAYILGHHRFFNGLFMVYSHPLKASLMASVGRCSTQFVADAFPAAVVKGAVVEMGVKGGQDADGGVAPGAVVRPVVRAAVLARFGDVVAVFVLFGVFEGGLDV